jgi:sortase A
MSRFRWSPTRVVRTLTAPIPPRRAHRLARVLGVVGESLLTLGIVLGLFIVWELWWTDIGANRHQHGIVANLDWVTPAIVTPTDVSGGGTSTDPGEVVYREIPAGLEERIEAPPSIAYPANTETFATLYVPRWGYDYVRPISEGISRHAVLDALGIGHYPETALPGGWGNFAIAGHRTTFGKPFDRIEELQVGDALVVRTEGTWYVYHVTEMEIVRPWFSAAIAPVPGDEFAEPNGRYITLTTCHPRFSASRRYVVYGVLDYWAPAEAGYPAEVIPPEAATVPGRANAREGTVS